MYKFSNQNLKFFLVILIFSSVIDAFSMEPTSTTKPPLSYEESFLVSINFIEIQEFKTLVPAEIYDKLVKVYSNKSLLVVDKLKELDDIFMTLPETTLQQLPTPKAFRKLQPQTQTRIRDIYYSKRLAFEEKLKAMEEVMHELPSDQLKLIPLQSDLPGLLEFDVPVLLQFNGQIETYLLREHMTNDELETLTQIVNKKNLNEVSRARMIGRLLRDVYERRPEGFPIPLGDENPEIPEEVRRLGIHLMFSKEPFDKIDLFSRALNRMKTSGPKSNKFDRLKGPLEDGQIPGQSFFSIKQLEQFSQFIRLFQQQDNIYEL